MTAGATNDYIVARFVADLLVDKPWYRQAKAANDDKVAEYIRTIYMPGPDTATGKSAKIAAEEALNLALYSGTATSEADALFKQAAKVRAEASELEAQAIDLRAKGRAAKERAEIASAAALALKGV